MNILKTVDRTLSNILHWICVFSQIWTCLLIVASAILRYIFKININGSEELIMYVAFFIYFIGSTLGTQNDTQISADMTSLFIKNKKVLSMFKAYKYLASIVITTIFVVLGWQYLTWSLSMNAVSQVYRLPMAVPQGSIFVSFLLSDIYLIVHFIKAIREMKEGEPVV